MEQQLKGRKDFNPDLEEVVNTLDTLLEEQSSFLKNLTADLAKINPETAESLEGLGSTEIQALLETMTSSPQGQEGRVNGLLAKKMAMSRLSRLREVEELIGILRNEFNRMTADVDQIQSKDVRKLLQENANSTPDDNNNVNNKHKNYVCAAPNPKLLRGTNGGVTENEMVVSLQTVERILQAAHVDQHTTIVTLSPTDVAFHILAKAVYGAEGKLRYTALHYPLQGQHALHHTTPHQNTTTSTQFSLPPAILL